MDMIDFVVPDPPHGDVRVTFHFDVGGHVSISCICREALLKRFCDHRLRILEGRVVGIREGSAGDLLRARSWIQGSEIEIELQALHAVRNSGDAVVDRAQSRLARAMSG